MIAVQNVKFEK